MREIKKKSLGVMSYPEIKLTGVNHSHSVAFMEISTPAKVLKIETNDFHLAKKLVDIARELTAKQREFALSQWEDYLNLKEYTGYKTPNGEE